MKSNDKCEAPKELKAVIKEFDIPIYNLTVHIIISPSAVESRNELSETMEWEVFDGTAQALVSWNHNAKPGHFYVFLETGVNLGVLVHELFHLTHRMLEYVGVEFSTNNHEPFAYMNEYVIRNSIDIVKPNIKGYKTMYKLTNK